MRKGDTRRLCTVLPVVILNLYLCKTSRRQGKNRTLCNSVVPLGTPFTRLGSNVRAGHHCYPSVGAKMPSALACLAFAAPGEGAFDFFAEVGVIRRSAAGW